MNIHLHIFISFFKEQGRVWVKIWVKIIEKLDRNFQWNKSPSSFYIEFMGMKTHWKPISA